jgi:acetate kinase
MAGRNIAKPQLITAELLEELRQLSPFDPEHSPGEILLTEAFHRRFPDLPQVACFDTAFQRRYEAQEYGGMGFTDCPMRSW